MGKYPVKLNFINEIILFCIILGIGSTVFANTTSNTMKKLIEGDEEKEEKAYDVKRPAAEYKAANYRDPFRLQRQEKEETKETKKYQEEEIIPPDLVIQGVVWGAATPQAIVNDKVVKKGDIIQDAHILDITKEGIDIFYQGAQFHISAPASGSGISKKKKEGGTNE
ncbi:MAG: hypothetical protein MUF05_01480 [Candidatus Omnitrophica bacterium]|jgi:ABC-type transport system involved in cytochrome bd biosynthesis fused ATPase/permease subunit|nr:hypothetical protein [Candidatus Omnitrophota bacterium]